MSKSGFHKVEGEIAERDFGIEMEFSADVLLIEMQLTEASIRTAEKS